MPKFTEQEKVKIQEKLLAAGERLFATIGLRKVTIDNLSSAAGISHSAFYAFYESKERLFMEINIRKQSHIYKKLDALISMNVSLPPKELAKLYTKTLQKEFFADPIISSVDSSLIEYIARRIPPEVMEQNDAMDDQPVKKLAQAGVRFKFSDDVTVKATQAVLVGIACVDADKGQDELADILIDALIDKLVE